MHKLYPEPIRVSRGHTLWHNASKPPRTLHLRFHPDGPGQRVRVVDVPPGGEIELDAGYDPNIKKISPDLKRGPAPVVEPKVEAPPKDEGQGEASPAQEPAKPAEQPKAPPAEKPASVDIDVSSLTALDPKKGKAPAKSKG